MEMKSKMFDIFPFGKWTACECRVVIQIFSISVPSLFSVVIISEQKSSSCQSWPQMTRV